MRKVVSEFIVDKYTALKLDGAIPFKAHTKYLINGKEYEIVPVYDMPNCIAIKAAGGFVGAEVDFI